MRYVDMALDLTQEQFEQLAADAWFRDALLADIATAKVRIGDGGTGGWLNDFSNLAARLGWVIERDDAGYYALPTRAADLQRRVQTCAADAAPNGAALAEPAGAAA